ncbi:MAG: hypothetical protein M5R42_16460 [Rhodocyclaceae bacterium]|nr:hypothetical protein [Rhodocyclaceae bacterium]
MEEITASVKEQGDASRGITENVERIAEMASENSQAVEGEPAGHPAGATLPRVEPGRGEVSHLSACRIALAGAAVTLM